MDWISVEVVAASNGYTVTLTVNGVRESIDVVAAPLLGLGVEARDWEAAADEAGSRVKELLEYARR